MYGPCSLNTTLPNGDNVLIEEQTNYPFDDTVTLLMSSSAARLDGLTLYLRIPSWADGATTSLNDGQPQAVAAGTFARVVLPPGTDSPSTLVLRFPMTTRVERRYNNAASVQRGPLVFALNLQPNFTILANYSFDSKDYQILPAQGVAWNYGLRLQDDSQPDADLQFQQVPGPIPSNPFDPDTSPVRILAYGRLLSQWSVELNSAAEPPVSPVVSQDHEVPLTLLPFGATKLRIAEIPTLLPAMRPLDALTRSPTGTLFSTD